MPLKRCEGDCHPHTWGVDFLMVSDSGAPVLCTVTRGVLDRLTADQGHLTAGDLLRAFQTWRDLIERSASQKYDRGLIANGLIIVRPNDVA
jgi:hypothetical protein